MEFKSYDISMNIDSVEDKFTGKETIILNASEEELFLNAVDLKIKSIKSNGKDVSFKVLEDREEVRIDGKYNGEIVLEVEFSGEIKDVLMGLYKSTTSSGKIYTTQFESTGARRAFPCVDNPGYKAEFMLTLNIPKELDAISNMPVSSEKVSGDLKTVVFGKTPRMSTYLLYIGIGKFEEKSEKFHDMDLLVAAPEGHMGETDFPFLIARESVENYEEYFDLKYVLPKMHLISIPDFGAGAMENWGAITFREVMLNVSENTSAVIRRAIAMVIAHEIAHQWFGNLVTMKWWNDLWLNESFATFMSYKTVDRYHKDLDMWGDFLLTEFSGALSGDSLKGSHPIDVEVKSPDDVAQIFDEISYGKGASILRMIESFVGEDNFRDGIRKYLKEHKFGNAVGSDLWSSIASISEQPVEEIMGAWIKKQGYPVVTAQKNGDVVHIEQQRFLLSGDRTDDLWPIPLTVSKTEGVRTVLLKERELDLDSKGFIKLNTDETGFYRVEYSDELFDELVGKASGLSDLDKWGIVNDLYAFLCSGRIGLDRYLERIGRFVQDESVIVAESISGQLMNLNLISPGNEAIKKISDSFFTGQLHRIGDKKEGEEIKISILRGNLSEAYAQISAEYAAELAGIFKGYRETDPDLRGAVAGAYASAKNDLQEMVKTLKDAKSDEDRVKLISAMGWLSSDENYESVLKLIDENVIRKQDMVRFFMFASMNPKARSFMLKNYRKIIDDMNRYFVGTGYTSMIIENSLPFLGLEDYDRTRALAEEVTQPETKKGVVKGLEMLEVYRRIRDGSKA